MPLYTSALPVRMTASTVWLPEYPLRVRPRSLDSIPGFLAAGASGMLPSAATNPSAAARFLLCLPFLAARESGSMPGAGWPVPRMARSGTSLTGALTPTVCSHTEPSRYRLARDVPGVRSATARLSTPAGDTAYTRWSGVQRRAAHSPVCRDSTTRQTTSAPCRVTPGFSIVR